MQIYKLLSVLLEYPEQELIDNLPALPERLAECSDIDDAERVALCAFIDHLASTPLTRLQEDYVRVAPVSR